jgi:predicted CXXCH cytochrome family protein
MVKTVAIGVLTVASFAADAASAPGTGIAGSAHDWSRTNGTSLLQWVDANGGVTTYNTGRPYVDPSTGRQGTTSVTIGQCTKCHTLHQAKSTKLLWNHTLQSTAYRWDDPTTTAGTPFPTFQGDTYKGPTTKCLSCHDGLMASTDGMWFNRQFVTGARFVAAPGAPDNGHDVAKGANLSSTHPVAMPYPLNGSPSTYNFVRNALLERTEWVADPMSANDVRLFKDDGAGNIVAGTSPGRTGIECTSCHDVHNGARVRDAMLLTGSLSGADRGRGGYLCTQCHVK